MADKQARKRSRFRGRTGHTFLRLPHYVIRSPQWRSLSGNAIKFVTELASEFDGGNNGDLSLTKTMALGRGWRSGATRDRAEQEAIQAGFVRVTRHGHKGVCNLYAITWEPINDVGKGVMYGPEVTASRLWEKQDRWPQNEAELAQKRGQRR